jgi:hypothetical protein
MTTFEMMLELPIAPRHLTPLPGLNPSMAEISSSLTRTA